MLEVSGLAHILNLEFKGSTSGEARNGKEALVELARKPWDMVILEIGIPNSAGFRTLREILKHHPSVPVLVLSVHLNSAEIALARQAGASGYVHKRASRLGFVKAFHCVLAREQHFGESSSADDPQAVKNLHTRLSPREFRVLVAFADGKRPKEIAAELKLSPKTVSSYKNRVMQKLELTSTVDLMRYVIDHGLSAGPAAHE